MEGVPRNCPYCHNLFMDRGEGCCAGCRGKQEAQRQKVRDFLSRHLATDLISIAHGTGLSLRTVMRMRDDGFLAPQRAHGSHKCKKCGAYIEEGIYCLACVSAFAKKRGDLASRRMRDNMLGAGAVRREADSRFLADSYAKYGSTAGRTLQKSEQKKLKRHRSLSSILYEVDKLGRR